MTIWLRESWGVTHVMDDEEHIGNIHGGAYFRTWDKRRKNLDEEKEGGVFCLSDTLLQHLAQEEVENLILKYCDETYSISLEGYAAMGYRKGHNIFCERRLMKQVKSK